MGASAPIADAASAVPAHSDAYLRRRFANWFPLGLTYAFLYMGRYNLTVAKNALGALMTNEDFGIIFGAGTIVYGVAFVLNGPLTDKIGGRKAMLISAVGAGLSNLAMGLYIQRVVGEGSVNNATLRFWFSALYVLNMYFQSFGAVAIVKVNSAWFHVRERGGFSGIFGTMISSGIFFAYTVNAWILAFAKQASGGGDALQTQWVFFIPSALLIGMAGVEAVLLKDRPSDAGHADFDTGDASSGDADESLFAVMKRIISHPIILTVAFIELCTGVVRQGVMQWYTIYSKSVLALPSSHYLRDGSWGRWELVAGCFAAAIALFVLAKRSAGARKGSLYAAGGVVFLLPFMQAGWGGLLFVAGVIGGNVAGYVSDLFFQSRRAPAAGGLYALLFCCCIAMFFAMGKTLPVVASSSVPELQPGDRIVSVAGKGNLEDWVAVSEAFAAVPAACLGGSVWDSQKHMCSTDPQATDATLVPSAGTIPVEVERGGQRVTLSVKDPGMKMRAGDRRSLKATPEATRNPYLLGAVMFLMSLCVIGIHGLLSGTATMDFGGRKGTATAVGMIDGFVYLGTAIQAVSLGYLTERSWSYWPWFLTPFAVVGFVLCRRIWNARPTRAQTGAPAAVTAGAGKTSSAPQAKTGT